MTAGCIANVPGNVKNIDHTHRAYMILVISAVSGGSKAQFSSKTVVEFPVINGAIVQLNKSEFVGNSEGTSTPIRLVK